MATKKKDASAEAEGLKARSKRYRESYKNFKEDVLSVEDGVKHLKTFKATKFDQTVEVQFNLGIDPKHADQMIRSFRLRPARHRQVASASIAIVSRKSGPGRSRCGRDARPAARALVEEIEKTNFTDFDVAIATPDMMRFVGKLGKVLGPKGLMPSPKAGTVTTDVANVVKEFAAGKMEIRNDSAVATSTPSSGSSASTKPKLDRQHQFDHRRR